MKRCSINGCDRPHCARGKCRPHYHKDYYGNRKETTAVRGKLNYKRHKIEKLIYSKGYYEKNKDKIMERQAKYKKVYRKENKEKVRGFERVYRNKRYNENINVRLIRNCYSRINRVLKGIAKSSRTLDLIGCSIEELWVHLETQFQPGMTRKNHGPEWHIDHIIPCIRFDFTYPEQQKKCFHYSNLQPLWKSDNLSKGAKDYKEWLEEQKLKELTE